MTGRSRSLALLAAAALAARLPWLWLSPGASYDLESYARAAACPGPALYTSPLLAGRYPYFPLWWLILRGLAFLSRSLGGPLGLWFRLPGILGDLALCGLAWALAPSSPQGHPPSGKAARAALAAGLAWALNPLAALISAAHGQFDSLALALLLGAVWLLQAPGSRGKQVWAAVCIGAAGALKTWPLALLPLFLGTVSPGFGRVRFSLVALAVPCGLLLPWLGWDGWRAVAGRLAYTGADGLGLPGALKACFYAAGVPGRSWLAFDHAYRAAAVALLALAACWAVRRAGGLDLRRSLPWAAVTLTLAAPGLSVQYLAWSPALALAVSPRLVWRLSLAALPLALGFYALFLPRVLAGPWAWAAPPPSPALILAWGAANAVWWAWTFSQWRRLGAAARVAPLAPPSALPKGSHEET